jgi:hypothetical protein
LIWQRNLFNTYQINRVELIVIANYPHLFTKANFDANFCCFALFDHCCSSPLLIAPTGLKLSVTISRVYLTHHFVTILDMTPSIPLNSFFLNFFGQNFFAFFLPFVHHFPIFARFNLHVWPHNHLTPILVDIISPCIQF